MSLSVGMDESVISDNWLGAMENALATIDCTWFGGLLGSSELTALCTSAAVTSLANEKTRSRNCSSGFKFSFWEKKCTIEV